MPQQPADADRHSALLEVIAGKRRGPVAALIRAGLWTGVPLYWSAVALRRLVWGLGLKRASHPGVPVISVGNLTTGGTGKTPLVIWIATQLRAAGVRVAVLSRGYRSPGGAGNDETREIAGRLPDVPVLENADRVAAACTAVEELEMETLLLDDGFQHWRLARDLDLVAVDATNPFGYGHLLPRGLSREPASSLRRADWVVVTRANLVPETELQNLLGRLARYIDPARIAVAGTVADRWVRADGREVPLEELSGQPLLAFCGIGNPEGFGRVLRLAGMSVNRRVDWPDHHHYGAEDLALLGQLGKDHGAAAIVCTAKDLVKIPRNRLGEIPLFALRTEFGFRSGGQELTAAILTVAGSPAPASPSGDNSPDSGSGDTLHDPQSGRTR